MAVHFDALGDCANLQDHVEARGLIDGELQGGLAGGLEARLLDSDFVGARGKAGDRVLAFGAGARGADFIGVDVADANRRVDDTARLASITRPTKVAAGVCAAIRPANNNDTESRSATNKVRILN